LGALGKKKTDPGFLRMAGVFFFFPPVFPPGPGLLQGVWSPNCPGGKTPVFVFLRGIGAGGPAWGRGGVQGQLWMGGAEAPPPTGVLVFAGGAPPAWWVFQKKAPPPRRFFLGGGALGKKKGSVFGFLFSFSVLFFGGGELSGGGFFSFLGKGLVSLFPFSGGVFFHFFCFYGFCFFFFCPTFFFFLLGFFAEKKKKKKKKTGLFPPPEVLFFF